MLTLFLRFLRFNRRFNNGNNNNNNNFPAIFPVRYKKKLQTIKDILNSEEFQQESEDDYRAEEDELMTKEIPMDDEEELTGAPLFYNNPFNSTEISPEFIENLAKLIKLKSKKW